MMRAIRSLWIYAYMLATLVFYATPILVLALFHARRAECRCLEYARRWARGILRVSGTPVRVHGLEHIDPRASQVFISNHESWYDIFALLAHLPGAFRFVGKKELERLPVFAAAFKACGHVFVDRGDHAAALQSMAVVSERVRREPCVAVILPEGTRTRTGELLPFKKGAFVLAIEAQVPIVPAGIAGSRAVLPKGEWRITPGPIELVVGEPLDTRGLTLESRDRLLHEARERVLALRAEAAARLSRAQTLAPEGMREAQGRFA